MTNGMSRMVRAAWSFEICRSILRE